MAPKKRKKSTTAQNKNKTPIKATTPKIPPPPKFDIRDLIRSSQKKKQQAKDYELITKTNTSRESAKRDRTNLPAKSKDILKATIIIEDDDNDVFVDELYHETPSLLSLPLSSPLKTNTNSLSKFKSPSPSKPTTKQKSPSPSPQRKRKVSPIDQGNDTPLPMDNASAATSTSLHEGEETNDEDLEIVDLNEEGDMDPPPRRKTAMERYLKSKHRLRQIQQYNESVIREEREERIRARTLSRTNSTLAEGDLSVVGGHDNKRVGTVDLGRCDKADDGDVEQIDSSPSKRVRFDD